MRTHKMKRHTKIVLGGALALAVVGGLIAIASTQVMASGWGDGHHGARHGHMMDMFDKLDANGDGAVSRGEIDSYRSSLLKRHDADNNQTISLDEFEGLLLEQMRPMVVDRFQMLDDDGDGQITTAEVDAKLDRVMLWMDRNGDDSIELNELRGKRHGHGYHHDSDDEDDD
ncbi:MAG: hypothetical protein RIC16_06585 [Rhodospirillales bacterium]